MKGIKNKLIYRIVFYIYAYLVYKINLNYIVQLIKAGNLFYFRITRHLQTNDEVVKLIFYLSIRN
ncbi:hypothetical protein ATE49_10170 [Elizabethkingia miricola]|nr:hypothetical protein ATE49_10170 [Elizabethkingia miricola]